MEWGKLGRKQKSVTYNQSKEGPTFFKKSFYKSLSNVNCSMEKNVIIVAMVLLAHNSDLKLSLCLPSNRKEMNRENERKMYQTS